MARDLPEPCQFPSLHSCHRRFLLARKEVDLAPYPVVGLVLQVGDATKCLLWLRKAHKEVIVPAASAHCFTYTEELG